MEMKIVEHLSDEDRQILFGWGYDLFGVAAYGLRADAIITSHRSDGVVPGWQSRMSFEG